MVLSYKKKGIRRNSLRKELKNSFQIIKICYFLFSSSRETMESKQNHHCHQCTVLTNWKLIFLKNSNNQTFSAGVLIENLFPWDE